MNKLLSVIVPCYNMEAHVASCLESVLGDERIEVIAVNDGSTDSTATIIDDYVKKYPESCRIINKPNGNYGSAINAGLHEALGKYVRILDADDHFLRSGLSSFLDILERTSECDIILSPFVQQGKRTEKIWFGKYGKTPFTINKVLQFDEVLKEGYIEYFMMHTITYLRSLLQKIDYHQTEGISYTDQQWVFYPLFHLRTIMFTDVFVYSYTLGREGQTMDTKVLNKSVGQLMIVTEKMGEYTDRNISMQPISLIRKEFLLGQIAHRMSVILRLILLEMDDNAFQSCDFPLILRKLKDLKERLHINRLKVRVNPVLRFDLLKYWERHGRRPRRLVLGTMRFSDRAMKYLYSLIFR
ncbi:MAG: glycosyltransferase family 2 protein [Alistipes sp.]|nr:glycosyltransferase family 2 protein [Candidatus Alistipes equi]